MIQKSYITSDFTRYYEKPVSDRSPIEIVDELVDFGFLHKVYSDYKFSWGSRSENYYANMLLCLSDENAFNELELVSLKSYNIHYINENEFYNDFFKQHVVLIPIFGYGFNNCIYVEADLFSFLNLNTRSLKNQLVKYYVTKILELYRLPPIVKSILLRKHKSEYDVNEAIIKLMHYSIQYKRNRTI